MTATQPALLVVTGLAREAQIAAGNGVMTICSGGDPTGLHDKLSSLFSARPREGGDPAQKGWIPAYAGMSGEKIRAILSFGLAGGLAPALRPGDVVMATHVTAGDAQYDISFDWLEAVSSKLAGAIRIQCGAIAGMDRVLTKSADKAALHAIGDALSVDMESHIAASYAQRHGLPFAALRAISDPVTRSLPDIAAEALTRDGNVDLSKVLGGLVRHPGQLPALIAAGIDSERAFASLRRCRRLLGPFFGLHGANL